MKRVRLRRKTRPVIDEWNPPHPLADQSHQEGQAASDALQSQQQCQQCVSLLAEVGELRGMVADYEARLKDAQTQLANTQWRLATAEDRADWLQAAMRSGSLPPPFVQGEEHV